MTEEQWLACEDPRRMVEWLTGDGRLVSDRKLRLFTIACARRLDIDDGEEKVLSHSERVADGEAGLGSIANDLGVHLAQTGVLWTQYESASDAALIWARGFYPPPLADRCNLLRCIFGNPFRPALLCSGREFPCGLCHGGEMVEVDAIGSRDGRRVVKNPRPAVCMACEGSGKQTHDTEVPCGGCERILTWNNGTVRQIAESIYQDRAFENMPILADALESAGCEDEAILGHCRGAGPHCRGCWVTDAILGKE